MPAEVEQEHHGQWGIHDLRDLLGALGHPRPVRDDEVDDGQDRHQADEDLVSGTLDASGQMAPTEAHVTPRVSGYSRRADRTHVWITPCLLTRHRASAPPTRVTLYREWCPRDTIDGTSRSGRRGGRPPQQPTCRRREPMTDAQGKPAAGADDTVVIAAQVVADDQGVLAEGAVAVEGDHVLLVARFADTECCSGRLLRPPAGRDRRQVSTSTACSSSTPTRPARSASRS